jgi:hypothetical protein
MKLYVPGDGRRDSPAGLSTYQVQFDGGTKAAAEVPLS